MAKSTTAPLEQTSRLLDLVPFLLSHQGISLTDLAKHFKVLKTEMLYEIAEYLFLVPRGGDKENEVDIKAKVNFSPMLPNLLLTYPHIEEDWRIAMASLKSVSKKR